MIPAIDAIRKRLAEAKQSPAQGLRNAAVRIQRKLQADATTHRGNVPSGIVAEARPEAVTVTAPSYVIKKARELGQIQEWKDIVRDECRRAFLRGG